LMAVHHGYCQVQTLVQTFRVRGRLKFKK